MVGSQNDQVFFNDAMAGPCTLDVGLANPLQTLGMSFGWNNTLTMSNSLTVSGGNFALTDATTTIDVGSGLTLKLMNLTTYQGGYNPWSGGTITGEAHSVFLLEQTNLAISGAPVGLGTNMFLTAGSIVELSGMTVNLNLIGESNYIDIQDTSALHLYQVITANGQQNNRGGIAFVGHDPEEMAIQMEGGGAPFLERGGTPVAGVADQVVVAGYINNLGGTVDISAGTMLNITGTDALNNSYWQLNGTRDALAVRSGANISAAGKYQIATGTVYLVTGGASTDRLDGAGLIFSNNNPTTFNIADAVSGTPGTVTVKGPVTLAGNTTTTMSYTGAPTNTADLLDVQNGTLTLAGTLSLTSTNGVPPTVPLNFFDDIGGSPAINGAFARIVDSTGAMNSTGKVVTQNANLLYYQITIK